MSLNPYTLERIADDAREQEWMARREANGATMCDQCGCWDDVDAHGYGPVIEIIATSDSDSWCRACALETQIPGSGPDSLTECPCCGEWSWEGDGEWVTDDTMSVDRVMPREAWVCEFCATNPSWIAAWFAGKGE